MGEPRGRFAANGDGRIAIEEAKGDPFGARSLEGIDRNVGNRDGLVTADRVLASRGIEDEILPTARELGIAITA